MRRGKQLFCILSLSAFLVGGCLSETTSDPVPPGEDVEQVEIDQDIMEKFRNIAKDSPKPDVLIQLINDQITEVSTENADEMVDTLRSSLEDSKQLYEERLIELDSDNELLAIDGSEAIFNESSISEIENEELKNEVEYLYSNFYQLINLEGGFYPVVDYSKLNAYDKYLSQEFQQYLEIKTLESKDRSMADGELTISFEELAERIYQVEDYLKTATTSERKDEILEDYQYKISAYLKGLPNTPIVEDGINKIKETVLTSYQQTADKDYEISTVVKEYLDVLAKNDNLVDEKVLKQADALIITALTAFEDE